MTNIFLPRLTVKESAEYLGVNVSYIYHLINKGTLPSFESNKVKYVLISDLVEFKRKQKK